MLGHDKVISSAYDKAPIYVLFKKQPTPDSFNLINNLSIYRCVCMQINTLFWNCGKI